MFTRLAAALIALAVLALPLCAVPSHAHEGHDHGAPPPVPAEVAPRAEAASAAFELVALPRGGDLWLFLDVFATNAPVAGARVEVETPDGPRIAEPQGEGRYRLPAPWLAAGGHQDLMVTVAAGDEADVLALSLDRPGAGAAGAPAHAPPSARAATSFAEAIRAHLGHQGAVGAAAAGFLLGLATIMLVRARRAGPALALLAVTLGLLAGGAALAHEGHSDDEPDRTARPAGGMALPGGGHSAAGAPPAERAYRLPDGAVFVPKPTQHLLGLRTGVTALAEHRRTVELPGRVIADPNASGVVQSSVGGRLAPPPGGFPALGARVRRGDVLATVTPPVQAVDASDMRQTQGNLDQQIAVTARRVARYEQLSTSGAVSRTALDDARAELDGLRDRRAALDSIRREPEALSAPVDGVIAERAALAGQMAAPGTVLFRIVDPARLYVEALSFEAVDPAAAATGRLPDGRALTLAYRGSGLADRNQAVPVQFAITGDAEGVRLGQFVTVLAPTGGATAGLALPRSGVIRSEGGSHVYEHVSAERFEARPVRVEPLDAERVIVAGGLAPGRRIVTQGAELLDQVR